MSVVVFDLDDTLYLERDFVLSGYKVVSDYLMVNYHLEGFEVEATMLLNTGGSQKVFNRYLENHEFNPSVKLINELISVYRNHIPEIKLPRSSEKVLKTLKARGRNLSIITDGYLEVQKHKVEALGVEHLVDHLVYSDLSGREHWKPAVTSYNEVMSHFQVKADECIYIGDNPQKDFYGARSLGWKTIRLRRSGGLHVNREAEKDYEADIEITEIEECLEYC